MHSVYDSVRDVYEIYNGSLLVAVVTRKHIYKWLLKKINK